MDDTGWDADIASARAHDAVAASPHDDTAPQPVVGHDAVPHHTDEPRFNVAALAASVVVAVVALGAVAGFGMLRSSADAATTVGSSSSSRPASALLTPAATGAADATATGVAAMLPPSKPTLVLGDSLGLVVYPWLADQLPDRYVSYESEVGRSTPDTAKKLGSLSSIPPVVIVSSGTNDGYAAVVEESARKILDKLGPERCVVWVDVVRPDAIGDSAGALNAAIDRAVAGHANVRVLRWSEMVAAHPEWMSGDGIHPNEDGAKARSEAFAAAAAACSPLDPTAPRSKQQVLPQSIFWGPISGQYTGKASSSGGNGGATSPRSSASSSRTSSSASTSSTPRSSSASTPAATTSAPAPAPTTAPPDSPSPTTVASVGAGAGAVAPSPT